VIAADAAATAVAAAAAPAPLARAQAAALTVYAAGSLRAVLSEIAADFEARPDGAPVHLVFGAAGLLRERLLAGEAADLFASASLEHPQALRASGRAESVRPFARNALCALAAPSFALQGLGLIERLLDERVKLGTSTPKSDPSGDYAFEMFERAEACGDVPPGGAARLKAKALQLTGGPGSPLPPRDRNVYGALVADGHADVFITYRTNAAIVRREQPQLQVLPVPERANVSATYGLAVLKGASPQARRFADFLLGEVGQRRLRAHGFAAA
jgi:ABC-type molybdate transport system substrate-binding protein